MRHFLQLLVPNENQELLNKLLELLEMHFSKRVTIDTLGNIITLSSTIPLNYFKTLKKDIQNRTKYLENIYPSQSGRKIVFSRIELTPFFDHDSGQQHVTQRPIPVYSEDNLYAQDHNVLTQPLFGSAIKKRLGPPISYGEPKKFAPIASTVSASEIVAKERTTLAIPPISPIKALTPKVPYTLKIEFLNGNTHLDPYFTTITHMFPGVTKIEKRENLLEITFGRAELAYIFRNKVNNLDFQALPFNKEDFQIRSRYQDIVQDLRTELWK